MLGNPGESAEALVKREAEWKRVVRAQLRGMSPTDNAGFANATVFMADKGSRYKHVGIPLGTTITPVVQYVFGNGQCHALALAMREITGFPVFGVWDWSEDRKRKECHHYVLHCPSGLDVDVDGLRCVDWKIRPVSHNNLLNKWYSLSMLPPAMTLARHYAPLLLASIDQSKFIRF